MRVSESRFRSAIAAALCAAALLAAPRAFAAPADSTLAPPPLPIGLRIEPPAPCAGDTVWLVATNPCKPCFDIVSFERGNDGRLRLVFTQMNPAACATLPCQLQERRARLGVFAAGRHEAVLEVVWHLPPDPAQPGLSPRVFEKRIAFEVGRCGPYSLPFIERVDIGGPNPCLSCPPQACPGHPVNVGLRGALPDRCWKLLGFEVLPLMSPGARPVARLTVRAPNPLVDLDCMNVPVPFSVGTSLPPQSPGPRDVEIQVAVRGWEDSTALKIASQVFAYVVKDSCPPPQAACVWPFLEPRSPARLDTLAGNAPRCDLRLMPGGRGPILFTARAEGVPLAGLQGEFGASSFLKVVNVEAVGAAAGMRLDWTPRGNGASYVLYAASGAPIPAGTWAPVLRVTVAADPNLHGVAAGYVHGAVTAASDSNGSAVPVCPIMTLVEVTARVCIGEPAGCDANGDGVSNVADLVRMVRCLLNPAGCPDTVAARPDCNGDGVFRLDDVFCCARAILGGPRGGGGRDPGDLRFSFGEPVLQGSRLRVPLRVQGAGDLAGALLRIDYPSDRWVAVEDAAAGGDPSRTQAASGWTPLVEAGEGEVLVGLLRLEPDAPGEAGVMLAFELRPGAEPGGEIRVGSSELSAADGTPIALDLASLSAPLEPGAGSPASGVALSAARPNPSSGATNFVVSLPAAGSVDLAMYDLAGRRVATLYRGVLPAGSRAFTWNPGRVPSGVYFARLAVDGEVRSSRVTLKLAR